MRKESQSRGKNWSGTTRARRRGMRSESIKSSARLGSANRICEQTLTNLCKDASDGDERVCMVGRCQFVDSGRAVAET